MMKRLITLVLALAFCLTGSGYAAYDIILISDSLAPGVEGTDHCDDPLVAFLEGLGYTVDTSGMDQAYREGNHPFDDPAKVAALNSAGMVIVTRRTNSGSYDNDRKLWNELENPVVLMGGYLTRGEISGKRWGWTTGGSGDVANKAETDADFGVSDLLSNTMFDWSGAPDAQSPKGPYLPNVAGGEVAAGAVIATFDGRPWLIDIPAGTDLDALNGTTDKYGVTGDRRVFLGAWGYDTPGTYAWGDFMTIQYKALVAEVVHEVIPEPATIALLGLGGLVLLRRKR